MIDKLTKDPATFFVMDDYTPRMGPGENVCPRCHQEGLYLATEEQIDWADDKGNLANVGSYPVYACDDCEVIWCGRLR